MPKTVEFALGAAILSHVLLALLWAGWASRPVAAAIALGALCGCLWRTVPGWRPRRAGLLFVPAGALYLVHTLAPETAPDAIAYHLGMVNEWLRTAGLARRDWGLFDVIPHGLETLFYGAVCLGGFTAAKVVHFAFFAATVPLLIEAGRRLQIDARPAALIYFATPVAAVAGTAAYNDAAIAFYALVTWLLLNDGEDTWAGLAAGFCYAIKLSGGVITALAGVYLLRRRAWRGLALAAVMAAPWMWHSWRTTDGNPVAPMLSAIFPSAAIHPNVIAGWTDFVRSYGVAWNERWREATLIGERTQGLLGPAFLLSPIALFVPRLRWWTVAAASAWLLNAGTRFLMPAAVFIVLAMAARLPVRVMWTVALAQAVLCWPAVLALWTPPGAWRLPASPPWRAALRLEPEPDYLRSITPAFATAAMVNRHTRPGERLLDFTAAPRAWLQSGVEAIDTWQYARGIRATEALLLAASGASPLLYQLRGAWPARKVTSIRLELLAEPRPRQDPWSIQEARLLHAGAALFSSQSWSLAAEPNPWDAPLVFDRNPASAWRTRQPRSAGEVSFEVSGDLYLDGIELLLRRDEAGPSVRVTGVDAATNQRIELAERLEPAPAAPAPNPRPAAIRYLRREGFRWILTSTGDAGVDRLGRTLVNEAQDWGLTPVERSGGVYLLRLGD